MRVLNLHGLGGSGENTNSRIIRKMYPKAELVSETIDYFHTNPEDIIDKYCSYGKFDFVLGNSFGGFFA